MQAIIRCWVFGALGRFVRRLGAVRAALVAAVFWAAAPVGWAAPLSYAFAVSSFTCMDSGCAEQTYFSDRLNAMRLTLDPTVDPAHLLLGSSRDPFTGIATPTLAYENTGVLALDLSGWGVQTDLDQGTCPNRLLCRIALDLSADASAGQFRLDTDNDNLVMSGLAGLWSGTIFSDGPYMTSGERRPFFSGQWMALNAVPEPGTLALCLTAGLMVATLRQRRRLLRR